VPICAYVFYVKITHLAEALGLGALLLEHVLQHQLNRVGLAAEMLVLVVVLVQFLSLHLLVLVLVDRVPQLIQVGLRVGELLRGIECEVEAVPAMKLFDSGWFAVECVTLHHLRAAIMVAALSVTTRLSCVVESP